MVHRTSAGKFGVIAIAASLVVMVLSMTPLAGSPSAKSVLLGSGLLGLTSSLILLQLRFFREGDAKKGESAAEPIDASEVSAPGGLKNPRQRLIWAGMERTRALMTRKEAEIRAEKMLIEKTLLGLDDEEEILYLGDRSWLSLWPVALLSVLCVAASTVLSGTPALLCLAMGITGLGSCAAAQRRTRYYITNFRVLVRRRPLLGGNPRWRVMHYPDIRRCSARRMFARTGLRLEGDVATVDITGLNSVELETVHGILQERMHRSTSSGMNQ
jgi:hypothetical protein